MILQCSKGNTADNMITISHVLKELRKFKQAGADGKDGKVHALPPQIQRNLELLSDHLQKQNISIEEFHKRLDTDGDGVVDENEWLEGVGRIVDFRQANLNRESLKQIFKKIDVNGDGCLTVNELAYYIEGAKQDIHSRISRIPQY